MTRKAVKNMMISDMQRRSTHIEDEDDDEEEES